MLPKKIKQQILCTVDKSTNSIVLNLTPNPDPTEEPDCEESLFQSAEGGDEGAKSVDEHGQD